MGLELSREQKKIDNILKFLNSKPRDKQIEMIESYLDGRYRLSQKDMEKLSEGVKSMIKNWDIDTRISIVEKYAEKSPQRITTVIDWFDIKDEKKLEEFALKILKNEGPVCENIEKFNIQDENIRINIAKEAAKSEAYTLPANIERFNIKNQEELVNIAKILVSNNVYRLCTFFTKFNILDEQKRIDIAYEIAKKDGRALPYRIEDFKINDERVRVEIAKKVSEKYPIAIAENIENFKIQSEVERINIVNHIIKKGESTISRYIDNFDISSEDERIKIAKLLAKINARDLGENIERYDIQDEDALFDILKEVIIKDRGNLNVAMRLDAFKIHTLDRLNYAFGIIMSNEFSQGGMYGCLTIYENYVNKISDSIKGISISKIKQRFKCGGIIRNIRQMCDFYYKKINTVDLTEVPKLNFDIIRILGQDNVNKIEAIVKEQRNPNVRDESIEFIEKVIFAYKNCDYKLQHKDELTRAIIDVITIKSQMVKEIAMPLLIKCINDNSLDKVAKELKINNKEKAYMTIFANIFDKLSLYDEGNKDILDKLRQVLQMGNVIKDSKAIQNLMITLMKLDKTYLNNSQIKNVIACIIREPSKIKDETKYIGSIMDFKRIDKLENINPNDGKSIKEIFSDVYKEYLNIKDKEFMLNYEKFVSKNINVSRKLEEYIMIYVAKKNSDSKLMEATRKFIENMGDRYKFEKERYSTEENSHLARIKELCNNKIDGVYNKWTKGIDLQIELDNVKDTEKAYELRKGIDMCNYEYKQGLNNNNAFVTDDVVDLFLLGTEVEGSCQSVLYNGEFSSCLMGYVVDGKNKAVVIKDKKGKIKARCVIRLLIDEKTNNIVMVREKMYKATGVSRSMEDVINERAIDYAKWLGVSLIIDDVGNRNSREKYKGTLIAIGGKSPAPYEYVDIGLGNFSPELGYKIQNNELVYLYKES